MKFKLRMDGDEVEAYEEAHFARGVVRGLASVMGPSLTGLMFHLSGGTLDVLGDDEHLLALTVTPQGESPLGGGEATLQAPSKNAKAALVGTVALAHGPRTVFNVDDRWLDVGPWEEAEARARTFLTKAPKYKAVTGDALDAIQAAYPEFDPALYAKTDEAAFEEALADLG